MSAMSTNSAMGMGTASVPMMLPSAVPAIARRARERDGALGAPLLRARTSASGRWSGPAAGSLERRELVSSWARTCRRIPPSTCPWPC